MNYIEIQNLLSFGVDPQRVNFDQGTTVLVGPNGGGKTNVLRAIELLRNLVRPSVGNLGVPYSRRRNPLLEIPPHRDHLAQDSSVTLGICFNSDYECELIALYVAGCIANSIEALSSRTGKSCDQAVVRTRARELGREFASDLSNCTVLARHDRRAQSEWVVEFCFTISGVSYSYALSSPGSLQQVSAGDLFRKDTSQFPANSVSSDASEKLDCESLASWSISQLLPEPGQRLNLALNNTFNYDSDLKSDLLQAGLVDGSGINQSVTLRVVLDKIMNRSLRFDVDDNGFGSAVTYEQTPLQVLIVPTVTSASSLLTDLYRWKMGDLEDRQRFQRAQQIFRELRGTGETFDLRASLLPEDESKSQPNVPNQRFVSLEPVIISPDQASEVRASFAGSGAAEFVRLSSYLASDEATVILLDEPAARLHPTAQTRLLRFIEESKAQNVIISHSPSLLPLGNIGRIALDVSRKSRVRTLSLADDQGREDSSSIGGNSEAISKTHHKRPIASQLHKDPILRSIPFAEAVIFVSGDTEAIVYPQWFQSWLDSRPKPDRDQTSAILTDVQDVEFVNFRGDDNFAHYLRVAVAFGIPWAMIADGNSYRPVPDGGGLDIPSIAHQIRDVCNSFDNSIDSAQLPANGLDSSKNYDWFQSWKHSLEQCGIFSLATCWKKKINETVSCHRVCCNRIWLETGTSCDRPGWHMELSHAESFEDFCDNESDFSNLRNLDWWKRRDKVSRALELVDAYPACPSKVATLFDSMSRYWQENAEGFT
jgi:energy-coupling factor transporter ATP-binding protein EcfA2